MNVSVNGCVPLFVTLRLTADLSKVYPISWPMLAVIRSRTPRPAKGYAGSANGGKKEGEMQYNSKIQRRLLVMSKYVYMNDKPRSIRKCCISAAYHYYLRG